MDRRRFLQNLAVTVAAAKALEPFDAAAQQGRPARSAGHTRVLHAASTVNVDGHVMVSDDYFTKYVEPNGMINMRGPETARSHR